MKLATRFLQTVLKQANNRLIYTTGQYYTKDCVKVSKEPDSTTELRAAKAPWIKIGEFRKGLMSHLSTIEIFRALFVLKLCSFDFVVDSSTSLIRLYKKIRIFVEWPVRKTFFDQFVGGDTIPRMTRVMNSMHKRGIRLMFCPVLEEDIEDEKSSRKFYDGNLKTLIELVELTATLETKKPMFHLKPSAILPAVTLEKVSIAINRRCKYSEPAKLAKLIAEMASSVENSRSLCLDLSSDEKKEFIDGLRRADILVRIAKKLPVHILVDGEFHSCKPAISAIALALMSRHNKNGHIVGNTIQSYLKEALCTIKAELEVTNKLIGVNWFGKIVRGAYMDRERLLAKKRGYESPIWANYEETNKSYNACVHYALEHLAQNCQMQNHLVVAGHNERSIRLAAQKMKDLGLASKDGLVSFAQIYGMSDYLSTPLTQEGYNVYKSTPFGPIEGVLPYLARRASENRSVIKGAREERNMLQQELKTRIYCF